ncbi:MAG: U32 family peptidase [Rhodospirillales bacterium]|nr:U32 family peptidase [Rhodospirillales bacterium]
MIGLTLGPLLFHWPRAKRRDFYFRIADEAPVDCVHLGEVVCSKREPFAAPDIAEIAERLRAAGKQVVLSTLALVTSAREVQAIRDACEAGFLIEANDVSSLQVLEGRPHIIGPLLNILNEGSLAYVARRGAIRIAPPMEVSEAGLAVLAAHAGAMEIEAQVFGRQTLSVSARCYHARSHGLHKDNCRFVCEGEPDGLAVDTLDGRTILTVNGTQTMSHGYVVLLREMADLVAKGVRRFRLSPQDVDMVAVARLARATLDGAIDAEEATERLQPLIGAVPMVNGYLHGREGLAWVPRPA